MADKFFYRSGPQNVYRVPVASGTVIEFGYLLKASSGKAIKMASAADDLKFIGVAAEAHYATDPSGSISVHVPNPLTVFEYDLDAATDITFGDALQMNTAQKLKKSTTDSIALANESKLQATNILCTMKLPHVSGGNLDRLTDAS